MATRLLLLENEMLTMVKLVKLQDGMLTRLLYTQNVMGDMLMVSWV